MATEPQSLRLQTDPDTRLAAAVGAAARHLADVAGLEARALEQLQSSVVAACREAFKHLAGSHPHLDVTLTRFADRIEVAIFHLASAHDNRRKSQAFPGVDRVNYETRGAERITRLTKFIGRDRSAN